MKHIFTQDKAIVITGPQGCGKTQLAKVIADSLGGSVVVSMAVLSGTFNTGWAFATTVVVEEFNPWLSEQLATAKGLASSGELIVCEKGKADSLTKKPNFIFVTGDARPLPVTNTCRRFMVIDIS